MGELVVVSLSFFLYFTMVIWAIIHSTNRGRRHEKEMKRIAEEGKRKRQEMWDRHRESMREYDKTMQEIHEKRLEGIRTLAKAISNT